MLARPDIALVEFGQAALASADLPTLMRQAVALVAHALDVAYSAIWELLPDRGALLLQAGVGWQDGAVGYATVTADATSPAGYTLLTRMPVLVADWASETRFSQPPLLRDHGVICGLSVVIQGQNHPFGAIGADSTVRRAFTD